MLRSLKNEYLPLIFASIFIGVVVGVFVGVFNYVARLLVKYSGEMYAFVSANLVWVPALFVLLIVLALVMALIHKKVKAARGGGMPQTIAMCKGEAKYKWWQVMWSNVVCSFMSFFGGLPLGAEGPVSWLGNCRWRVENYAF